MTQTLEGNLLGVANQLESIANQLTSIYDTHKTVGEIENNDSRPKGNNCGGRYSIEDIRRQRSLFSSI